jgi:hypothetical protein
VSDVKQLFDRRMVMRCDVVLCAALHQTQKKQIEIESRRGCKQKLGTVATSSYSVGCRLPIVCHCIASADPCQHQD